MHKLRKEKRFKPEKFLIETIIKRYLH